MNSILEKLKQERLEKLNNSLKDSKFRVSELKEEISELESEHEDIIGDIKNYEQQIEEIEKGIPSDADEFTKRFIQASRFCSIGTGRVLEYVNITENSLQAINNARGIEIICDIPKSLKGRIIHNSACKNFEESIAKHEDPYPNIAPFMDVNSEKYPCKYTLKASEWIDIILVKGIPMTGEPAEMGRISFYLDGIRIGINKYYVADLFSLLDDDENVTLHWQKTPESALLFTTDKIKGLIMPLRLRKESLLAT